MVEVKLRHMLDPTAFGKSYCWEAVGPEKILFLPMMADDLAPDKASPVLFLG